MQNDGLQKRIPDSPKHILLVGAGASFGSDGKHLYDAGHLPPLGRDLFQRLKEDESLKTWNRLPDKIKILFKSKTFEEAMDYLDSTDRWERESFERDLDLFRYFSRFSPQPSNLYWKLARHISRKLTDKTWSGAIVTLNYDRMIEESLMKNYVFTVVKGVTFYDDKLPSFENSQLFEVCYPHGACQFFMGQNWFQGTGNIVFGPGARMLQDEGVNHILNKKNIPIACDHKQIPMICRYQSSKRPSVRNYFIDLQQRRADEIFRMAESITILGVSCAYKIDKHIWESLAQTNAKIHYLEPSAEAQNQFREWAEKANKRESKDFIIKENRFKDGFAYITAVNKL